MNFIFIGERKLAKTVISVNNLSFSYTQDKKVLDDISFSINEGEYVCLIGHNGSGKSTIAKILMGLNSNFDGSIKIFDIDLNKKNLVQIRQDVGIVFQNPDNQFVGSTVADDIAFGLENKKVSREEMDKIIHEVTAYAGIQEFLDHEPSALSGGQKQRVAIAGVLAMQPKIVILDEATSMLDPKGKREVGQLIDIVKERNPLLTIISITHDIEEARKSDKVIVLNEGKIVYFDSPKEVFQHIKELKAIHLDSPFLDRAKHYLKEKGQNCGVFATVEELGDFLCR